MLNLAYYAFRRSNWILDWRRYFSDLSGVVIDRPIFLLGVQRGGLTLVGRMLRRNQKVVSVTGDYRYWTGADEMQSVLGPILPPKLSGITHKAVPDEVFGTPRGRTYATDRLLPHYRTTAEDASRQEAQALQELIKWIIARHGGRSSGNARFIDKSQLFTIKLTFLDALLDGCDPRFVLITRDPYAVCQHYAADAGFLHLKQRCSFEQRLGFAAQHWSNSMRLALEDGKNLSHFVQHRIEDIVLRPREQLQQICDFAELEFSEEMLPQPEQRLPLGTRRVDRWYPIRDEVNSQYVSQLTPLHIDTIERLCGEQAAQLGYTRPHIS